MARELIRQGVKSIALLSRREVDDSLKEEIKSWVETGLDILTFAVDVSNKEDLRTVIHQLNEGGRQLKAVIHSAGLLSDATVINQTKEHYQTVYQAKVDGAWNLHELTQSISLDHFVVFSSAASIFGPAGQSNHAAANVFLDQLIAHRHSKNLAGLSINWGVWSETGTAQHLFKDNATYIEPIETDLGLRSFCSLLTSSKVLSQVAVMPGSWLSIIEDKVSIPNLFEQFSSYPRGAYKLW